jgi:hypothetical protein
MAPHPAPGNTPHPLRSGRSVTPQPSVGALRQFFPLVHNLSVDHRQQDLQIEDVFFRTGHQVAGEDQKIGELPGEYSAARGTGDWGTKNTLQLALQ